MLLSIDPDGPVPICQQSLRPLAGRAPQGRNVFGVATDCAVFLVRRYREELSRYTAEEEAVAAAQRRTLSALPGGGTDYGCRADEATRLNAALLAGWSIWVGSEG